MEMKVESKHVDKTWGHELWLVNNELYCAKILTIEKNKMCSIHYHTLKDETFTILFGEVKLQIFDAPDQKVSREYIMHEGDAIRLPPETIHRFIGMDDLSEILEVSTQHFEEDSYRILPAGDYIN